MVRNSFDTQFAEYPRDLGATVAKFRRMANAAGGLKGVLYAERRAYGEAVEKAIRAKQSAELRREFSTPRCNCASGTNYTTGAEIHAAVQQQQRNMVLGWAAAIRKARTDAEWAQMYDAAMREKRARQS